MRAVLMGTREDEVPPVRRVQRGLVVTPPPKPSDPVCSVLALHMPNPIPSAY